MKLWRIKYCDKLLSALFISMRMERRSGINHVGRQGPQGSQTRLDGLRSRCPEICETVSLESMQRHCPDQPIGPLGYSLNTKSIFPGLSDANSTPKQTARPRTRRYGTLCLVSPMT